MTYPQIVILAAILIYIISQAYARSEPEARLVAALVSLLKAILSLLAQIVISVAIIVRQGVAAYLHLEPRILIAPALLFLLTASLSLVLGKKAVAEQLGVYAYYFLIGGILLLFIRFVREGSGER